MSIEALALCVSAGLALTIVLRRLGAGSGAAVVGTGLLALMARRSWTGAGFLDEVGARPLLLLAAAPLAFLAGERLGALSRELGPRRWSFAAPLAVVELALRAFFFAGLAVILSPAAAATELPAIRLAIVVGLGLALSSPLTHVSPRRFEARRLEARSLWGLLVGLAAIAITIAWPGSPESPGAIESVTTVLSPALLGGVGCGLVCFVLSRISARRELASLVRIAGGLGAFAIARSESGAGLLAAAIAGCVSAALARLIESGPVPAHGDRSTVASRRLETDFPAIVIGACVGWSAPSLVESPWTWSWRGAALAAGVVTIRLLMEAAASGLARTLGRRRSHTALLDASWLTGANALTAVALLSALASLGEGASSALTLLAIWYLVFNLVLQGTSAPALARRLGGSSELERARLLEGRWIATRAARRRLGELLEEDLITRPAADAIGEEFARQLRDIETERAELESARPGIVRSRWILAQRALLAEALRELERAVDEDRIPAEIAASLRSELRERFEHAGDERLDVLFSEGDDGEPQT